MLGVVGGGGVELCGCCDVLGPRASEVHIAAGLAPPLSLFLTLCHLSPQQCSWSSRCYKYDALYSRAFQSKPRHHRVSIPRDLVLCCHLLVATEVTVRTEVPFLVTRRQVVLVNVWCWWTFGRETEG